MTCPKCGAKIEEGMLLCSRCGAEIKYVPDFDPELENSIQESMSNVAATMQRDLELYDQENSLDDLDEELLNQYGLGDEDLERYPTQEVPNKATIKKMPTQEISSEKIRKMSGKGAAGKKKNASAKPKTKPQTNPQKPKDPDDFENDFDEDFWDVEEALDFTGGGRFIQKTMSNPVTRVLMIFALFILIGIIVSVSIFISGRIKKNSFEYKYEQAKLAYEQGDYAHAVYYMESAANMHSDDLTVQYELADYYTKNNQQQAAILTYRNIIRDFDTDVLVAYTKLFAIYEELGDFESINNVLADCDDPSIISQFQQYLADAPEFSVVPGSYDDPVYLVISGNPSGKIYYTTDGSTPDNESMEYTSPLYFEKGAFHIKAIYINSFGLMSPITEGDFSINVAVPDSPIVNLESGEFETPKLIAVEDIPEDCVVYYTTDGSLPTKDSNVYKNPLLMPLGSSQFQFVTYNFDDVPSEPTVRDFLYLQDESLVTAADATQIITMYRMSLGGMADLDGTLTTLSGKLLFLCEAAVDFNERDDTDNPDAAPYTKEDANIYYVINEYYQDINSGSMMKTGYVYCVSTKDMMDYGTLKVNGDGNYVYTRAPLPPPTPPAEESYE